MSDFATVPEMLARQADRYGDKPYLLCPETGRVVSYRELAALVERTAGLLQALGIRHGDKVSILLPNVLEFYLSYFGAMQLGAVAHPLNIHLKPGELAYILEHAESRALLTRSDLLPLATEALAPLPAPPVVLTIDGEHPPARDFWALHAAAPAVAAVPVEPEDESVLIYTSGTTARPKGVLLTHRNLIADARYLVEGHGFTERDRALAVLPLFHVNGMEVTMVMPLSIGASVVLPERFRASTFWQTIAQYQVTWFSAVPTIYAILLNTPTDLTGLDLSSLRFGMSAAAPLPRAVHEAFEARFGCPILEGYGLSEATDHSTCNPPPPGTRKVGSIGRCMGHEMRVVDDANRPLPPGVEGEIVIRGENLMKGYYKDPAATAQAIDADGWLHTGDLGTVDEEGYFFVTGRKKELINRAGEKIAPREVEEVLYRHPDVRDAAVIGVPHPLYGEEVKAYVALGPGATTTPEEIMAFCRPHLAEFKLPKSVEFIPAIPRSPSGKIVRRHLLEHHLETVGQQ